MTVKCLPLVFDSCAHACVCGWPEIVCVMTTARRTVRVDENVFLCAFCLCLARSDRAIGRARCVHNFFQGGTWRPVRSKVRTRSHDARARARVRLENGNCQQRSSSAKTSARCTLHSVYKIYYVDGEGKEEQQSEHTKKTNSMQFASRPPSSSTSCQATTHQLNEACCAVRDLGAKNVCMCVHVCDGGARIIYGYTSCRGR